MAKDNMTIEDLGDKFNSLDDKFNGLSDKFDGLSGKVDNLAEKLDKFASAVDKRFEQVDKRFEQIDKRFDEMDKKIEDEVGNLAVMTAQEFGKVYKKIDNVNTQLSDQIEALRKEQSSHDFKMTEMIHKDDYFKLEGRVELLEKKVFYS